MEGVGCLDPVAVQEVLNEFNRRHILPEEDLTVPIFCLQTLDDVSRSDFERIRGFFQADIPRRKEGTRALLADFPRPRPLLENEMHDAASLDVLSKNLLGAVTLLWKWKIADESVAEEIYTPHSPSEDPPAVINSVRSKKIGIVGAGPSGLTTAYYLTELGFDPCNITVFEKESRVGGHVFSYPSPAPTNDDPAVLEHGAAHILEYYDVVFELLREFDVRGKFRVPQSKLVSQSLSSWFDFLKSMAAAVFWDLWIFECSVGWLSWRHPEAFQGAGFKGVSKIDDLCVSIHDFLKRKYCTNLERFFELLSWALCLVDFKFTPIGVFLKFFPNNTLLKFIWSQIVGNVPAYYVDGGYDKLMTAIKENLQSKKVTFKLESLIRNVVPSKDGVFLHLSEKDEGPFDFVVLTSMWTGVDEATRTKTQFMSDLEVYTEVIQQFVPQIQNPCVLSFPVSFDPKGKNYCGDYLVLECPGKFNEAAVIYNPRQGGNVFQVLCPVDNAQNDWEIVKQKCFDSARSLVKDITDADCTMHEGSEYWCPIQPVVSAPLLRCGFFDRIESYQGRNGIFYSNIYFTFSYSGLVMRYAKDLVVDIGQRFGVADAKFKLDFGHRKRRCDVEFQQDTVRSNAHNNNNSNNSNSHFIRADHPLHTTDALSEQQRHEAVEAQRRWDSNSNNNNNNNDNNDNSSNNNNNP